MLRPTWLDVSKSWLEKWPKSQSQSASKQHPNCQNSQIRRLRATPCLETRPITEQVPGQGSCLPPEQPTGSLSGISSRSTQALKPSCSSGVSCHRASGWIWMSCVSMASRSGPWLPIRPLEEAQVSRHCKQIDSFERLWALGVPPLISERVAREPFMPPLDISLNCGRSSKPSTLFRAFARKNVDGAIDQTDGGRKLENQHLVQALKVIVGGQANLYLRLGLGTAAGRKFLSRHAMTCHIARPSTSASL